jgi:aryl-alcohol dehydrogenase-like predicted oxidoreductase
MKRRQLGTTDLEVSAFCLGGNVFGWTADERQSFAILDAYTDAGGNLVDTSDSYQTWVPGHTGHESETVIGRWLASRRARDRVLVATKVGGPLRAGSVAHTAPNSSAPMWGQLHDIRRRVDGCLRRLGTDHVDILYAHVDDPTIPIEQYLADFDHVVRAGKARYIAASNFRPNRLAVALRISRDEGLPAFKALTTRYSLLERGDHERSYAPLLRREGLGYLPYWPLAKGFLTGKYVARGGTPATARSARAEMLKVGLYDSPLARSVVSLLAEIAEGHGTNAGAVALAWVGAQPGVTSPVVSTRTPEQLTQLLEMPDLQLTEVELGKLGEVSSPVRPEDEPASA